MVISLFVKEFCCRNFFLRFFLLLLLFPILILQISSYPEFTTDSYHFQSHTTKALRRELFLISPTNKNPPEFLPMNLGSLFTVLRSGDSPPELENTPSDQSTLHGCCRYYRYSCNSESYCLESALSSRIRVCLPMDALDHNLRRGSRHQ